jgi:cytochrome c biogenesis protein CcmG/thiol:disulfide interchange protein DsbE
MGRRVERAIVKFAIPLGVVAIMTAFLIAGLRLDPREVPSPLVDRRAPAFSLVDIHHPDQTLTPAQLLGKVWLLNVWASWCVSCRAEHALLTAVSGTGVLPIYGLAYKDRRSDSLAFLGSFGNPYVVTVEDVDGRTGIDYGVYGVPESYLVDRAGVIRFKQIGPITLDVLEQAILPMLGQMN